MATTEPMVLIFRKVREMATVGPLHQVFNLQSVPGHLGKNFLDRNLLLCLWINLFSGKELTRILEQFFKPSI